MITKSHQNDLQMTTKWHQHDTKMTPKWTQNDSKMTPTWPQNNNQMTPKCHPNDTKMTPKGAKEAPKVNPKSTKIPQKIATLKKVEKGRSNALSFGINFDIFLLKNALKNRCEKLRRKTCQKTWKLSKKTGTILSPKKKILKFLLQRRILENSVFTKEKQCFLKIPCFESVHTFEKRTRKK